MSQADVKSLARWPDGADASLAFMPARVLMQDFTGVPAVVDLAAMRSAVARAGGDPKSVNPFVPVDLVIDHSVTVDEFGDEGEEEEDFGGEEAGEEEAQEEEEESNESLKLENFQSFLNKKK